MKKSIAFFLFTSMFICCNTAKRNNKNHPLTSRYKTIGKPVLLRDTDTPIKVSTQVFAIDKKDDKSKKKDDAKTFFDLKSGGQNAIINQIVKNDMDEKEKDAKEKYSKEKDATDKINKILNKKFQEDKDHATIDLTEKKINIVFSVSEGIDVFIKNTLSMADRIERLYITLTLDDNSKSFVKFNSWDRINTQYGQFNIASVSFSASKAVTINPSVPIGSAAVATSVGSYTDTKSYQEADTLIQRFILLNGVLNDDNITLQQCSTPAIDLLGNTSVNIAMKFTMTSVDYFLSFDGLKDDDNKFNPPDKVEVSKTNIVYPQFPVSADKKIPQDIGGNLMCSYTIRHVKNEDGQKTYSEGDDDIEYYYGRFSQHLDHILRVEESKPKVWSITRGSSMIKLIDKTTTKPTELHFSSEEDAFDFEKWLVNVIKTQSPDKITIQNYKVDMAREGEFSVILLP